MVVSEDKMFYRLQLHTEFKQAKKVESTSEMTSGRKFYEEQLKYIIANDVDGLIDNHYNENAVLVGFDFSVKGRAALKDYFRNYLKQLGNLQVKSTDKFNDTEDTVFLQATVTSARGEVKVFDAFCLQNGKISYHFTGVI